jgi:alanine dehydrogenase
MVPGTVAELVKRGHRLIVQRGAGERASYSDTQYEAAGAESAVDTETVSAAAKLVVKVKEPQRTEVALLRREHVLFTCLHLAAAKELTESLLASGCNAITYETR